MDRRNILVFIIKVECLYRKNVFKTLDLYKFLTEIFLIIL